MEYIEVVAVAGGANTVSVITEKLEVSDFRVGVVGANGVGS
jgi:hypothetical protein